MNDKKYLLLALTLCSLLMTICTINETYAKYVSSATSTASTSIARWKVLVNSKDITLGATSSNLISPIFPGSENINSGVLAPNAEGYFDLIIDASQVDVSFQYTISVAVNKNSPVTELVATKYIINGEDEVVFDENNKYIDGDILLRDTSRGTDGTVNIRIYVKWDDSLELMDNKADTETTTGNQFGMLDVSISVIQI